MEYTVTVTVYGQQFVNVVEFPDNFTDDDIRVSVLDNIAMDWTENA
jgi:hypothetical protein